MARMKGPDRVRAALDAAGLDCETRTLPDSTRTAGEAAALGEPVSRADAAFVRAQTGFAIGGVPPLGHATPLAVFMDADLLRFDRVWAAAGSPHSVFPMEPARLCDASGATAADLKV